MKRILLSLLGLILLPCLLFANGEPVIYYSANIHSANPVPLKVAEVQVVREDLNIRVKLPYTEVSVVYRLKNSSAEPIHVDYGFPVDFDGKVGDPYGFDEGGEYSSMSEHGIADKAVRDVHFRLDGKELPWTQADTWVKLGDYEDEDGKTVEYGDARLWTYAVLDIPAGATVSLEVDYSVLCSRSIELARLQASPLSRYFFDDGCFVYNFTPAQHWGNGKAGELAVKVDYSALPKSLSPEVQYFEDIPFEDNGKVWTMSVKNYDFATANNLAVRFQRDYSSEKPYPSWGDPLKNCAIPSSEYRLSVSGAQDKYPASNMQDGDLASAWVAPGNGVGATVDIVFPKPRRVSDIALYNGYHKSATLWSANSRIKRLKVDITRADGTKESWESDLSEEAEWWNEHSYLLTDSNAPSFGAVTLLSVTDLHALKLERDENGDVRVGQATPEVPEVSSIRLTVLDVVPGTKYKDLCLSELSVLDGFVILTE